ncbi:hypothetical protein PRIPAC_87994 [Pristionchus pacificus]|uniref:RNA binding protein n=1 Tax=Pristionchus pacificus TaxID=54126 RepID=A0A2A6CJ60_PRIPA|nr:hypothetical protein PRIPAC_87994 [Pristionchus pacificus]|eukprot:PDM78118.1 RNA binding protein [Pristionchus pacificus]
MVRDVNRALDDIIREKKNHRGSGVGTTKRGSLHSVKTGMIKKKSTSVTGKWDHSGFDEMYGGKKTTLISRSSGPCKVDISNLNENITTEDLEELFSQYAFTKVHVHFDESGSSIGTGAITLNSRNDAERLINDFRGCKVDGKAILLSIVDLKRPALKVERPTSVTKTRVFSQIQRPSRPEQSRGWMHDDRFGNTKTADTRRARGDAKGGKKSGYSEAELDAELDAYMKK